MMLLRKALITLAAAFESHWLAVLILGAGTWLRVWNLDNRAIFFGDAAHDLLSAVTAVESHTLPLLGIASSVPRFKQGPLTVWLEMATYSIFGVNTLVFSLVFALIGIAAMVAMYELLLVTTNKRVALLALTLISFSPLAIAHSRMPYHITPIPLMMVIFLTSLVWLWEGKKHSIFASILAWALLFQFELATAPLFILVPLVLWQRSTRPNWRTTLAQAGSALGLGLLPQILFDLTHSFAHLGGFALWVGYRLGSSVSGGSHTISFDSVATVAKLCATYLGRIGSPDLPTLTVVFLATAGVCIYFMTLKLRHQELPPLIHLSLLAFYILIGSFFIHGSPSEAYFPPFIILLPILVGYGLAQVQPPLQWVVNGSLIIWLLVVTGGIVHHNFFVDTPTSFSYGTSLGQQRTIGSFLMSHVGNEIWLRTTNPGGAFENYFDNFRWVAKEQGWVDSKAGTIVFIESGDSVLQTYPDMIHVRFPTTSVYVIP